jgi:hypothetical protein
MKGTVPPSFSRPITATSDCMERFSVFAICRSISGERVLASAMFAVSILAAMGLEKGRHPEGACPVKSPGRYAYTFT